MGRRYDVFSLRYFVNDRGEKELISKTMVGSTFAVSPAKAAANVRYRLGKRSSRSYSEYGDSSYIVEYEAEAV